MALDNRYSAYLGEMRVVEDANEASEAGQWAANAVRRRKTVEALVPPLFERYARIFHPAMRRVTGHDRPRASVDEGAGEVPRIVAPGGVVWREVTWSEIADANGRVSHPKMQWPAIAGRYEYSWGGEQPGLWERIPKHGSLSVRLAERIATDLAPFTAVPSVCWFAVWTGHGDLVGLTYDAALPRLELSGTAMILAAGPLSYLPKIAFVDDGVRRDDEDAWSWNERYRSPSAWWPEDRTWFVATDSDMQSTYVGGSAAAIERLLDDSQLEVMVAEAAQDITLDSDRVNPTPAGDPSRA